MKISQEAREAALVLRDYVAIRGLKDGQIERSMQSLINSTLEKAALEIEQFGELDGSFLADVIRQLIEE